MLSDKILIIGAGPSLSSNLEEYKRLGGFPGIVICTDGALNKTLKAGIIPTYCSTLEDTADLDKYYNTEIVKEKGKLVGHCYVSDRVHPKVKTQIKEVGMDLHNAGKVRGFITSNVGLFSWLIAGQVQDAKEIYLIGTDHCYSKEKPPPVHRDSELFQVGFHVLINSYNDEELILHPAFLLWKEEFDYYVKKFPEIKTVNCTGRGALFNKEYFWQPIKDMKEWKIN